jgi:N-acetylneuraminic acid mutarotase
MRALVNKTPLFQRRTRPSRTTQRTGFASLCVALTVAANVWSPATAATGPWSRVTSLPTARYGLVAVVGPNGKIYAIGGVESAGADGGKTSNRVEAYDPATNSWTIEAPMPSLRDGVATATGPDGKIYGMGGIEGTGFDSRVVDTVEAYSPTTNTWSAETSMPTGLVGSAAVTGRDGKIYVVGGDKNGDPGAEVSFGRVEVYDPTTNSWAIEAPMPTPRSNLAATRGANGKIYAIGGQDAQGTIVGTVEAYDPATNAWSSETAMPTARDGLGAATGPNGRIYALGGYTGGSTVATVEIYDTTAKYWSRVSAMPTAREDFPAVTGLDGRIYAIGGGINNGGTVLSRVDAYTSGSETSTVSVPTLEFTKLSATDRAGYPHRSYAVGSSLYVHGTYKLGHAATSMVLYIAVFSSYWYSTKKRWVTNPHPVISMQHRANGTWSFTSRHVVAAVPAEVTKAGFDVEISTAQTHQGRFITVGVRRPKLWR